MLPLAIILGSLGYLAGKAIQSSIEQSHRRREIEHRRYEELDAPDSDFETDYDENEIEEYVPRRSRRRR